MDENKAAVAKNGKKSSLLPQKVNEAPLWLMRRMETLRQMQPPTLQEVRTQMKASVEIR
jgi:hypothetical protein